jgi:hypothetical protein
MPAKKDAEWWRDYRARKAAAAEGAHEAPKAADPHAQCDARIAELEAEVARLRAGVAQPARVDSPVDTSTPSTPRRQLTSAQRVAAGLAAPDDDCVACGHDRQGMHMSRPDGRCRCGCPAFVDSAEPF